MHFYEIYTLHVKKYEKLQNPILGVLRWGLYTEDDKFHTDIRVHMFYTYICSIGNETITLHTFILYLILG